MSMSILTISSRPSRLNAFLLASQIRLTLTIARIYKLYLPTYLPAYFRAFGRRLKTKLLNVADQNQLTKSSPRSAAYSFTIYGVVWTCFDRSIDRSTYRLIDWLIVTPKLDAANRSLAEATVAADVWAKYALMFAIRLLINPGTLGHMYFVVRHEKCLQQIYTIKLLV